MPLTFYERYTFRAANRRKIDLANEIIEDYARQGYTLTLRQLYYQFVSKDYIPNTAREYKNMSSLFTKARLAGLMDWEGIEDRTRTDRGNTHWDSPQQLVRACAEQFMLDSREDQDTYVEVWIEKDALVGVIESVCKRLDVRYFACKGYVSASAMWKAGQRFLRREDLHDQQGIILYLGDHDPSGIQMTEDIQRRMTLFGTNAQVNRIALNMDQIKQFKPPPNFAAVKDPRSDAYIQKFGDKSWELDALTPSVIVSLIEEGVEEHTDWDKREAVMGQTTKHREQLDYVAENWRTIFKREDS